MTVNAFLLDQIQALSRMYHVYVAANFGDSNSLALVGENITIVPFAIERKIFPWRDLVALVFLFRLFRRYRFDIVHSVTPKAGLLAMTAGAVAGIPVRLHTFQGEVWVTRNGIWRAFLKSLDWLVARLATHLLAVSRSEKQFLIEQGIVPVGKSTVLASGSISGVDIGRFKPNPEARMAIREAFGIGQTETIFLYIGRLTVDKGLLDLASAFSRVCEKRDDVCLFLVGPDEENIQKKVGVLCRECGSRVHFAGYTDTPEHYMAAADVFFLPSYREGFGTVIIEAASVGIPAVASRIYGIVDAVEEGVTGLLHDAGDVESIVRLMKQFSEDVALREKMGGDARNRVRRDFSMGIVTSAVIEHYKQLMHSS